MQKIGKWAVACAAMLINLPVWAGKFPNFLTETIQPAPYWPHIRQFSWDYIAIYGLDVYGILIIALSTLSCLLLLLLSAGQAQWSIGQRFRFSTLNVILYLVGISWMFYLIFISHHPGKFQPFALYIDVVNYRDYASQLFAAIYANLVYAFAAPVLACLGLHRSNGGAKVLFIFLLLVLSCYFNLFFTGSLAILHYKTVASVVSLNTLQYFSLVAILIVFLYNLFQSQWSTTHRMLLSLIILLTIGSAYFYNLIVLLMNPLLIAYCFARGRRGCGMGLILGVLFVITVAQFVLHFSSYLLVAK